MNNARVAVSMVTWNSRQHLPTSLQSLTEQTFQPLQIMIVDNASVDGTVTWLEEHYPQMHLLRNTRNIGFCRAQNQAIRITKTDYVLVLNPDVVLSPDWIQRAVAWMDQHPDYGSFGGVLLRYAYSNDELKEIVISDIIDSAGLRLDRQRHAVDRGSGQANSGQFAVAEDVFGLSGACVLYRRSALESIRYQNEFFDEHFFAYKDDVDVAWRLQRLDWASRYDPSVRAWHHRGVPGVDTADSRALAKNERSRNSMIAYFSYRNHWLMLMKHETLGTLWRDGLWIGWYEFRKLFWFLLTRPKTLRAWRQILGWWPAIRRKRAVLFRQQRQGPLVIRHRWFLR